jgi:uncharacterized protein YndB with AHSA1/START domain
MWGTVEMLSKPQSACFVIADISGYTRFLAGVELDHANDIIADLMGTVVRGLRPPFRLAKLEGDAAFAYAVADKVDGSLLQDAIESTYFAFRRRLRSVRQATVCACNACKHMQDLDLKVVSHYGEFVKHAVAGRQELAGPDVILIHRLLKNSVEETLRTPAYALFSDACIRAMDIDPVVQGLIGHTETIDLVGEVACWLRDLDEAWRKENQRRRTEVTRDDAGAVFEYEVAAPRSRVWEYFTLPGHRRKWQDAEVAERPQDGRRGVGTRNHCMHGKDAFIEDVVDWRPFDYVSMKEQWPVPGAPKLVTTTAFTDLADGGTRIEYRIARVKPKDRPLVEDVLLPMFTKVMDGAVNTLRLVLKREKETAAVLEEPAVPVSSERFLSEPVRHPPH